MALTEFLILSSLPACGRPALDETGQAAEPAIIGLPPDRGRRSLVPESPVLSWTRGAWKTPTGAKGGHARERAC
jgi:hypothetical protein